MNVLTVNQMAYFNGGDDYPLLAKICAVVGMGGGVFAIGAAVNWWNPVGWLSAAVSLVGTACDIYSIYKGIEYIQEH